MRLAVIAHDNEDVPVIRIGEDQVVPVRALGDPSLQGLGLLEALSNPATREEVSAAAADAGERIEVTTSTRWRRPFLPDTTFGIGLNYRRHAEDLHAPLPQEPAFFTKVARTAVASGEVVLLPPESEKVTAEAELGLVVGRRCWRAAPQDALAYVAGACVILDQCAEDILHRNTRFLTRSKNFPSFLAIGSDLVTLDEVAAAGDMADIEVTTYHNGSEFRAAPVSDMLFDPAYVVSFLSHVLPLEPGDLVTTGTPGAATLQDGDTAAGRVSGVGTVEVSVRRPAAEDYADEVLEQLAREGHGSPGRHSLVRAAPETQR